MKRFFTTLLGFLVMMNSFAQIKFEQAYFIDNNNQRQTGLIKNVDWKNNPSEFEFKASESAQAQTLTINAVKEFGIGELLKYQRVTVKIDRSSDEAKKFSNQRTPEWSEEQVFLKVLLESKASLYYFEDDEVNRYFFKVDESPIEQLVYKKYLIQDSKVMTNNDFRQQLSVKFQCQKIAPARFEVITYARGDLMRLFKDYNTCQGQQIVEPKSNAKSALKFKVLAGIDYSNLSFTNDVFPQDDTDFGHRLSIRAGIEFEYILPFNNQKWSLLLQPAYHYFSDDGELNGLAVSARYSTIEIPLGLRHYFFINPRNPKKRVFINLLGVTDVARNTKFRLSRGFTYNYKDSFVPITLALGAGLNIGKLSGELRYTGNRGMMDLANWGNKYTTVSLLFTYTLN
jgi:hypothetical protein